MLPAFTRIRWQSWILAAIGLILAGFALRDAAVAVYSVTNPSLALAISPTDPRALPLVLDRIALAGQSEGPFEVEEAQLRDGLRAMPLSTRILRHLAVWRDAPPEPTEAATMLAISGQLSRRDMMTQVMLADAAARNGDAPAALRHINAALSTSRGAADLAFPFLGQLLAEPAFRPMIAEYVDQPWGDEFLYFAAQNGAAADALDVALRKPVAQSEGRFARFRSELLAHLVRQGEAGLAFDYVRRLEGPRAAILADPGFTEATTDTRFAPLSWALTNRDGIYADVASDGVVVLADPGARGVALERVFELAAGRWQLTAERSLLQPFRDARADWQFTCASDVKSPSLGSAELALSEQAGPVRASLSVPRSCEAVRVSLLVHNLDDQRALEILLAELALRRIEG